jgi:hypothetical protein
MKMCNDRVAKLESIGFCDESDSNDRPILGPKQVVWDIRFQQLVEYKWNHNGNCDVPLQYESNQELGRWVSRQHSLLKGKKMRSDRVAKLESIGYRIGQDIVRGWDFRFQQLADYKRVYGNCDVPFRYESNPQLGRWVSKQRSVLKCKKLRQDRVVKLESIGFQVGQARRSEDWEIFFEDLRGYVRNQGDCNVPENYHLNPSLVEWVREQRQDYSLRCGGNKSAMTAEREAKLNVLGFVWERRESQASLNVNTIPCPDQITSERAKRQSPASASAGSNANNSTCPDEVTSESQHHFA